MSHYPLICEICGGIATDRHHVYGGSHRQASEREGFVMNLCRPCHMRLHSDPSGEWRMYKWKFQQEYEKTHSHQEFMDIIGRNYEL